MKSNDAVSKKNNEPVVRGLLTVFYAVISFLYLFIIFVSVRQPLDYLSSAQMGIASVIFAGVLFLFIRLSAKIPKLSGWVYTAFLCAFGAAILCICLLRGNWYLYAGDYEAVYISAMDVAEGREVSFPFYFMTYGNNTVPMYFLAGIMKICRTLGINEFYILLALSIGTVLSAAWAMGYLLAECGAEKYRLPSLAFMALCLPIYSFSNTFYTDTMSFGLGIVIIALLVHACKKKKAGYAIAAFAGILTVWGFNWKITCIIPLIAALFLLLIGDIRKNVLRNKKYILVYAVSVLAVQIILLIVLNSFSLYSESKVRSNPVTAWIAMGMMNDGSYAQNVEFSDTVNLEFDTKEAKNEYAVAHIKEHLGEAFSISHIVAKTRNNYASGTFSARDYTTPDAHGSLMYNLLNPGGSHYWRACQYCYVYIFAVYIVIFCTAVYVLIGLIKKKETPVMKIVSWPRILSDISFFGLFLFLMLWESNNRQLYNSLPVIILGLFAGFAGFRKSDSVDL